MTPELKEYIITLSSKLISQKGPGLLLATLACCIADLDRIGTNTEILQAEIKKICDALDSKFHSGGLN